MSLATDYNCVAISGQSDTTEATEPTKNLKKTKICRRKVTHSQAPGGNLHVNRQWQISGLFTSLLYQQPRALLVPFHPRALLVSRSSALAFFPSL